MEEFKIYNKADCLETFEEIADICRANAFSTFPVTVLKKQYEFLYDFYEAHNVTKAEPGEWVNMDGQTDPQHKVLMYGKGYYACSDCGKTTWLGYHMKYCPECGKEKKVGR